MFEVLVALRRECSGNWTIQLVRLVLRSKKRRCRCCRDGRYRSHIPKPSGPSPAISNGLDFRSGSGSLLLVDERVAATSSASAPPAADGVLEIVTKEGGVPANKVGCSCLLRGLRRPILTLGPTPPWPGGANITKTAPATRFTSN